MSSSQEPQEAVLTRGSADQTASNDNSDNSNTGITSNAAEAQDTEAQIGDAPDNGAQTVGPGDEIEDSTARNNSTVDEIEDSASGVQVTLMLISGQRSKFNIPPQDEKTPSSITVEHFRNALFQAWKDAWGNSPSTAANIRLIHFGKVLEDSQTLEECGITSPNPTVVHVSVKPQSFELDRSKSNTSKSKSRRRSDEDRGARCCIIS